MPTTSRSKNGHHTRQGRGKRRRDPKHPVIDNRKPISTEEVARLYGVPPDRVRYIKDLVTKIMSKQGVAE